MTAETHRIYIEAKMYGFISKIATIWLYDNWEYNVKIIDFDEKYYCIDKPKHYDRKL